MLVTILVSSRRQEVAADRETQTIRLAAALKKLDGEKLATELPVSASDPKPAASGGRGKKAATARVAGKLRLSKAAVQKRVKAASAAIGEKIDLDLDAPEELERKADKRQQAEPKPKVERRKRTKPAPCAAIEDPTQPAEPPAAEIDRLMEDLWKAFAAMGRKYQLRFIHDACLRLGLDPLMMAPPGAFGLAEEDPGLAVDLPGEVPPATDDAAVALQAEQRDDVADLGTDGLQDEDDVSEAAHQVPGDATKCDLCKKGFTSSDPAEMFNDHFYHRTFCLEEAKPLAIAAE